MSQSSNNDGHANPSALEYAMMLRAQALLAYKPHPRCAPEAEFAQFIANNRQYDIYFPLGVCNEAPTKQPTKEQMRGANRLWADIDPPPDVWDKKKRCEIASGALERWRGKMREQLEQFSPPPSYVIDSGRGFWGLWELNNLVDAASVEAANKRIANHFGLSGDNCFNINRVARLPGTLNTKTGKIAELILNRPDRVYSIDDFRGGTGNSTGAAGSDTKSSDTPTIEQLSEYDVGPNVIEIIQAGTDPARVDRFPSRSEAVMLVCCELVRCGVPDDVILAVLLDQAHGISASIYTTADGKPVPQPEQYAQRQVERAKAKVGDGSRRQSRRGASRSSPISQARLRGALIELGAKLRYDRFRDRVLLQGVPAYGPTLDDAALNHLWLLIDERFGFRVPREFFVAFVQNEARRNGFHPIVDYLGGLQWDGQPRLDRWLITYAAAEDTPFVRAAGAITLIAAVRRVRKPGCKFDEMLVLESKQGTEKSSALALLATNEEWFADDLQLNADPKRMIETLKGTWIIEAAELSGLKKSDIEGLKAFLSRRRDRARMAYDRLPSECPRQCIVIGTTNNDQYLRDQTGNRRFWPAKIGRFDLDALRSDRDQLWAEAAAREAQGESIRLDRKLWDVASEEQEKRTIEDPFQAELARLLGDQQGKVRATEIFDWLGLGMVHQRTQEHNVRVGQAMVALGFVRVKLRFGGSSPEWCYVRGSSASEIKRNTEEPGEGREEIEPRM